MARYFSEVFRELRDYRGDHAFDAIILPWLEEDSAENRSDLQSLATYDPSAVGDASPVWLAFPYALSRISDVLLLGLQPSIDGSAGVPSAHELHLVNHDWPAVSRQEYLTLFTELGMTEITAREFDPFLHEIVAVEQTPDPGAPIEITEVVWPGLMLGEMLFNRAGVRIRAGADHAQAGVADRFILYSTFLRRYRATIDLSLGWGHASQWDTDFRRDYRTAEADHFNVDQSLSDAAAIGDSPTFVSLRAALAKSRLARVPIPTVLDELAERSDSTDLREAAASLHLAGTEGARIKEALAAKAGVMRARRPADGLEATNPPRRRFGDGVRRHHRSGTAALRRTRS